MLLIQHEWRYFVFCFTFFFLQNKPAQVGIKTLIHGVNFLLEALTLRYQCNEV